MADPYRQYAPFWKKIQQILDSLVDRLAALLFSTVYLTVIMFWS